MQKIFRKISGEQDTSVVRERIKDDIRNAICENKLSGGQKLIESEIALAFGVSRTPVRESLRQLEYEGLVVSIPNKGAIVSEVTTVSALKLFDTREVLEGLIARLACAHITAGEAYELLGLVERTESEIAAGHTDIGSRLYKEWRDSILFIAGNEYASKHLEACYAQLSRFKAFEGYNFGRLYIISEMKELVLSFMKNDIYESERIAKNHTRMDKDRFIFFLRSNNDAAAAKNSQTKFV